jgi:5-methylthioribose kinase
LDLGLTLQLAGVEIIRRLLGYAQLPLAASLPERRRMLEIAREWVLRPDSAAPGLT